MDTAASDAYTAMDTSGDPAVDAPIDAAVDSGAGSNDTGSGNPQTNSLCAVNGQPKPAGTVCRPSVGLCDQAESCDGLGAACPADSYFPATTACRAAAATDLCDTSEYCTGQSPDCPTDKVAAADKVCRPAIGECDRAEVCDGTAKTCPVDSLKPSTIVCRPVDGACDIEETCTGTSTECPEDAYRPSGESCRAASGPCDQDARCTGTSAECPRVFWAAGVPCRVSTGVCDPAEACSGAAATCPADVTYTPPAAAPATVTATSAQGSTSAVVTWTAVAGATGYTVKRSVGASTEYITVGSASTLSYTDTGLTGGTTYNYVVSASSGTPACESPSSTPASVTPTGVCTPAAPAIPANFAAVAGNHQIVLTWTAAANASSYTLARSGSRDTGYISLATGLLTGTTYTDSSLTNGTLYWYRIMAKGTNCDSDWSTPISATPACTPPAPAPAITSAVPDAGGQVAILFSPSTNAATYEVSRSTTSTGTYASVATLTATATATSYAITDKPLSTAGTQGTYYYKVAAIIDPACATSSAPSAAVAACKAPTAPTLTATAANAQATVSWSTSAGVTAYEVLRASSTTGTFTSVATSTGTSYTNTGLDNGSTYFFQVKANLGTACASTSGMASAVPCVAPAPTATTTATNNSVTLNWNNTGAPTYTIKYGTNSASLTSTATATGTSYTVGGLTAGTPIYAAVSSSNPTCATGESAPVTGTPTGCNTLPNTPTLTATAGVGQVTVSWNPVTGGTGALSYVLSYATVAGGPYTVIAGATSPYVHSGLDSTKTYYYVMKVTDSLGCPSALSTEASAKPTANTCLSPNIFCDDFEADVVGTGAVGWTPETSASSWLAATGKVYQYTGYATSRTYVTQLATTPNSQSIRADVRITSVSSASSSQRAMLILRHPSGSGFYALGLGSDGVLRIYKDTTAINNVTVTFALNTWYTMKFTANGSTLSAYFGDMTTPKMTLNDGTYPTGSVGLGVSGSTNADFDNVFVSSP